MIIDSLVSSYARQLNQRLMNFSDGTVDARLPEPVPGKEYLLYLHIPFCVSLCPFCSFHRIRFEESLATQYFQALQQEIRNVSERGYRFGEMYIGGGTPTVLPELLTDTIEKVAAVQPLSEVSVETNPHDLDQASMGRLKRAGVSRLSVGVQSFDDSLLREMQRYDKYGSGSDIRAHVQSVKGIFDTLNIDMIFNFPHQQAESLERDLAILTDELAVDQVSWYPLMDADSTRRTMARQMGSGSHDRERDFYELISRHMLNAGYQRSSAWCFSRQAGMYDEYIVEHEEYIGLGSGSFSFAGGKMFASTFSIRHYLERIAAGDSGVAWERELSRHEQMRYWLLMRLFSGKIDLDEAEQRFNGQFGRVMWRDLAGLRLLGAVSSDGRTLWLTESGQYLWVVLMREFFAGVNRFRDGMRQHVSVGATTVPLQASTQ